MMSIKRVSLNPDEEEEGYTKRKQQKIHKNNKKKKSVDMITEAAEISLSAVRFLKQVGANMARLVSSSEQKRRRQSCRKVTSSAAAGGGGGSQLGRSRSYADRTSSSVIIESHLRAEAIEDCIEFLNSSSSSASSYYSLHRSSSVSSSCINNNASVITE